MKKIIINKKYYGSYDLPSGKNAYETFVKIIRHYKSREAFYVGILFNEQEIKGFDTYQNGVTQKALEKLDIYIELSKILDYTVSDAKKLKEKIEFTNDNAYVHLDISGGLILINKEVPSAAKASYLFWDIENFSNVGPTFSHVIEPHEIGDENIYVICNPDSLYLFRAEWEADLYDYSKTLESFNFEICDHGKNVADGRLLESFEALDLRESDVYILTYDRELKERFKNACHESNNLYILDKKLLY